MPINLKDTKIDQDFILRCLIYGVSGAGKTTLAATFPQPIFMFDLDHKFKCLVGKGIDIDIESFDAGNKEAAGKEYARLLKLWKEIKTNPKYKTVIFDSLSMLDGMVQRWCLDQAGKSSLVVPDIQLWGHIKDHYQFLFSELNHPSWKKNIIVTAHEDYVVEEESKVHQVLPLISTKIRSVLPMYFEETYYIRTTVEGGKNVRRMFYQPNGKALANTQVLKGVGHIDDPTYDKILAVARGSK